MRAPRGIKQLDDDPIECRSIGHQWETQSWVRTAPTPSSKRVLMVATCLRCKSDRQDLLRMDGTLTRRTYHYSDNYLLRGVTDRKLGLRVSMARAELIRRKVG